MVLVYTVTLRLTSRNARRSAAGASFLNVGIGRFDGVWERRPLLYSAEVPSLDWPAVRLNPNLPPFSGVCLDRNTMVRRGRASPRKLRLAGLNHGDFWLVQWRNTKVGCLVILRKLMCYSFSAAKHQEVCALSLAGKFFTY